MGQVTQGNKANSISAGKSTFQTFSALGSHIPLLPRAESILNSATTTNLLNLSPRHPLFKSGLLIQIEGQGAL